MSNYIFEIWYSRLEHFSYGGMQILAFIVLGIKLKSVLSSKICGSCIIDRQQWQPFQRLPTWHAIKFLNLVPSDLGGPYPATELR